MAGRLSVLVSQLEIDLMIAGNKLLHLPTSTCEIINVLVQMEKVLSRVQQPLSEAMNKILPTIIAALIAKELVRHPDLDVNISVACCISEILRITAPKSPCNNEQIKVFFELVVTLFEKLSFASGGYYGKMTKVLEIFSKARLPVLMLDLELEGYGLIVRLFKQFLNSDSSSTAIVLDMEKIMTMLIEMNEKLALELRALIAASLKKDNQSALPVCWQFGKKVLMICATKSKPHLTDMGRDMGIALYDYPKMVEHISRTASEMEGKETNFYTTETRKMMTDTPQKLKLVCPEESIKKVQTLRHCQNASMPGMMGKRKRSNVQAQSIEHGDILLGRRIKIWWQKDENYREGVVKSFDCKYQMYKVLYDNGLAVLVDLQWRRWTLLENVSAIPDSVGEAVPEKVSSPQSGIICVQGYEVKNINASILEAILKKHGDIAAKCVFKNSIRASLLEVVCEIVRRIETNDVTYIISKMEEIESQVSVAEVAKINVSWLQAHLEAIYKRYEAQNKISLLVEMKTNTSMVKRAALSNVKERYAEFASARSGLVKAQKCLQVLDLLEIKLNNDVLKSKAEKDLWAGQPFL